MKLNKHITSIIYFTLISCICFSCATKVNTEESAYHATVTVNLDKVVGQMKHSELYNNNSLLRVPRKEVTDKYLEKFGKAKIMRSWLTLNDMWDYKTGEVNYDFPVGWGFNLWTTYYDYMDRFSEISEDVLLNIRGNHELVKSGAISMAKWKEVCKGAIKHYKSRYPNIRYIEALNEYSGKHFGDLKNDEYYPFYKCFYQIVNEINQELKPEIPLLVGGPCIMGGSLDEEGESTKRTKLKSFLKNFKEDTSEDKKLDFLSYHQYNDTKLNPSTALTHEALIDSWLVENGLSANIPIFIDEMGCFPGSRHLGCVEEDLFVTACNIASLMYYYEQQPDMYGFHWVIQHKTNERKNQILDDLRWTPYGISMLMSALHKDDKLESESDALVEGQGVYAVASGDENEAILQVWNYQWENNNTFDTEISFHNMNRYDEGKGIILTQYKLDNTNNNFLNSDSYYWNSDPNEDIKIFSVDKSFFDILRKP